MERGLADEGVDMGNALLKFFKRIYFPKQTVLVLVRPYDLRDLDRMSVIFSDTLLIRGDDQGIHCFCHRESRH